MTLLLLMLSCGTTDPSNSSLSDFNQTLRIRDPRIAVVWKDYDSTTLDLVRQKISFKTNPESFRWSYSCRAVNDTINPVYAETNYKTGTWRVSNDTLVISYKSHKILWDYKNNRESDSVLYSGDSLMHYRINDVGELAISGGFSSWYYYKRDSLSSTGIEDTTIFTAKAPSDTVVSILDTIHLIAGNRPASTPVKKYLWSFNGGKNYSDTTSGQEILLRFKTSDVGLHIGAVRAVDSNGTISVPDYFQIDVHTFRPTIRAHDTVFICVNNTMMLHVTGSDTDGTITKYYWNIKSSNITDSTKTGTLSFSGACQTKCTVSVFSSDNHGILSDTARFNVSVNPTYTYGSLKEETGVAVIATKQGATIIGTLDTNGLYEQYVYVFTINNTGGKVKNTYTYAGKYKGTYGLNYPQSLIPGINGGYICSGYNDNSYSTIDGGFIISMDDSLHTLWSGTYRDTGTIGGTVTDISSTPNGSYVIGGCSIFSQCTTVATSNYCTYYQRPYVACVNQKGELQWQRTFQYKSNYDGNVAVSSTGKIVFVSDSVIINMNSDGNKVWSLMIPYRAVDVIMSNSENILILASDFSGVQTQLVWVSSEGKLIKTIPVSSINGPKKLISLSDNTFMILSNHTVLHTNENGILLWAKTFDLFTINDMTESIDGNIIIAGTTENYGAGKTDAIVLKLDKDGKRLW